MNYCCHLRSAPGSSSINVKRHFYSLIFSNPRWTNRRYRWIGDKRARRKVEIRRVVGRSKEGWIWIPTGWGIIGRSPKKNEPFAGLEFRSVEARSREERERVGPRRFGRIWILLELRRGLPRGKKKKKRKRKIDFGLISVALPFRKRFYLRVFSIDTVPFLFSSSFLLADSLLSKFYRFDSPLPLPSLVFAKLRTFPPGNVSNRFMVFSCIVKIRKLLPFVPLSRFHNSTRPAAIEARARLFFIAFDYPSSSFFFFFLSPLVPPLHPPSSSSPRVYVELLIRSR